MHPNGYLAEGRGPPSTQHQLKPIGLLGLGAGALAVAEAVLKAENDKAESAEQVQERGHIEQELHQPLIEPGWMRAERAEEGDTNRSGHDGAGDWAVSWNTRWHAMTPPDTGAPNMAPHSCTR